jgi:hypothetical protein
MLRESYIIGKSGREQIQVSLHVSFRLILWTPTRSGLLQHVPHGRGVTIHRADAFPRKKNLAAQHRAMALVSAPRVLRKPLVLSKPWRSSTGSKTRAFDTFTLFVETRP